MPRYNYKAKNEHGKIITSSLEAASREEAIEKISRAGHYPMFVQDTAGARQVDSVQVFALEKRTLDKYISIFARQLANFLRAGMPISFPLFGKLPDHAGTRPGKVPWC